MKLCVVLFHGTEAQSGLAYMQLWVHSLDHGRESRRAAKAVGRTGFPVTDRMDIPNPRTAAPQLYSTGAPRVYLCKGP